MSICIFHLARQLKIALNQNKSRHLAAESASILFMVYIPNSRVETDQCRTRNTKTGSTPSIVQIWWSPRSKYFGYEVIRLERIRIMNIHLEGLPPGESRDLTHQELLELFIRIENSESER